MDCIEEFIRRRFPNDSNWTSGNCYYFAVILQEAFPGGKIVYEPIEGHFLYELHDQLYDWYGGRSRDHYDYKDLIDWSKYRTADHLHYERIVRDCIR